MPLESHGFIRKAETMEELQRFREALQSAGGGEENVEPLEFQVIKHNRNDGGQTDTTTKRLFKPNKQSAWIIAGVGGADALEYQFPDNADQLLQNSDIDLDMSLNCKSLSDIPMSSRTNELVQTIRFNIADFRFGCVRSKWDNIWPPDQSDFDLN